MDDWLRRQLETKTGGFRGARWQHCPSCGAWTLTGTDADIAGIPATVDPTPITPAQEYDAALRGRQTYSLSKHGKGWRIHDRDPYGIARDQPMLTIVPAHQCGHRYTPARPLK